LFGLVGAGIALLARRRDQPSYLIGKDEFNSTGRLTLYLDFPPAGVPILVGPIGNWNHPFPDGFDVEPD